MYISEVYFQVFRRSSYRNLRKSELEPDQIEKILGIIVVYLSNCVLRNSEIKDAICIFIF